MRCMNCGYELGTGGCANWKCGLPPKDYWNCLRCGRHHKPSIKECPKCGPIVIEWGLWDAASDEALANFENELTEEIADE